MTHLAMWEARIPTSGEPETNGATTSPTTNTALPDGMETLTISDAAQRATTTNCSPVTCRR